MTRKTRNSRINRKAKNLIKSIRTSLRKIKNKSAGKSIRGGNGQMGHTVMTESYFGRDRIGFGELENSPQQKGSGRLEAMGHTHQEPTGWDNAALACPYANAKGGARRSRRRRKTRRSRRRRSSRKVSGGDGQMGHTVMTESYFGRDRIGFGDLERSPQVGSGRLESMGHTNQPLTGWETAKSVCNTKLEGDVKFGGRRRRRRTRRKQSGKSCGKGRCSRRRRSSKRRSLRKR